MTTIRRRRHEKERGEIFHLNIEFIKELLHLVETEENIKFIEFSQIIPLEGKKPKIQYVVEKNKKRIKITIFGENTCCKQVVRIKTKKIKKTVRKIQRLKEQ